MTASPQPAPDADPAPEADPTPERLRSRRRGCPTTWARTAVEDETRRSPAAGASSCSCSCSCSAFALLLGLAIWYLLFRQPLPLPAHPGRGRHADLQHVDLRRRPADGRRGHRGRRAGSTSARPRATGSPGSSTRPAPSSALLQPPVSTGLGARAGLPRARPDQRRGLRDRPARPAPSTSTTPNGTYQRAFNPGAELKGWQPLGIAFDTAGNLYVTDVSTSPQRILVFDRTGKVVQTLGPGRPASTSRTASPSTRTGNVYVDGQQQRPAPRLRPERPGRRAGRPWRRRGQPRPAARGDHRRQGPRLRRRRDRPGRLRLRHLRARRARPSTTSASSVERASSNGTFQYPNGIAVDGRGRVYVTDAGNDRVQVWSY